MKILITGGAGSIGSNLVKKLLKTKTMKYLLLTIYGVVKLIIYT